MQHRQMWSMQHRHHGTNSPLRGGNLTVRKGHSTDGYRELFGFSHMFQYVIRVIRTIDMSDLGTKLDIVLNCRSLDSSGAELLWATPAGLGWPGAARRLARLARPQEPGVGGSSFGSRWTRGRRPRTEQGGRKDELTGFHRGSAVFARRHQK